MRFLLIAIVLLPGAALAHEPINEARAKFHYQMACMGCHTVDGAGYQGVPNLNGQMGDYLRTQQGREYLVRVPGSANAVMSDAQLAEVLNWMLVNFAGDSLSAQWRPFDQAEVAEYRKDPLYEVLQYRKTLRASLLTTKTENKSP